MLGPQPRSRFLLQSAKIELSRWAAGDALVPDVAKPGQTLLLGPVALLEESQGLANDFAGRGVTASFDLLANHALEFRRERDVHVLLRGCALTKYSKNC